MKTRYPLLQLAALTFCLLAGGAGAQPHTTDQRLGGGTYEPPTGTNGWQPSARFGGTSEPPAGTNGWRPLARLGGGTSEPPTGVNGWTAPARLPLPLTGAR